MQFREVKGTVRVLMTVYSKEDKRSRQKEVFAFSRYNQPSKVTADQLKAVPDEKRDAVVVEINDWLAQQAAERRKSADKYAVSSANRALMAALDVLQAQPDLIAEKDLEALAETLRTASHAVANRMRSIKMKARRQSSDKPANQATA